jgi:hypothetical protein
MELPFTLETDLEKKIADDPAWQEGVVWGKPRRGHLEGQVMYHIAEVLSNIDAQCPNEQDRCRLRLIALIHDTFKYQVDETRPKVGTNHHAYLARLFATRYLDDPVLLTIIEHHDDAYHCWQLGRYKGHWQRAEKYLDQLLDSLGDAAPLYARFFYADSDTSSKDPAPREWFGQVLQRRGMQIRWC